MNIQEPKIKENQIKRLFFYRETTAKKIEEIMQEKDMVSLSEFFRYAVNTTYDEVFNYSSVQKKRLELKKQQIESPEYIADPLDRKIASAEAIKERKEELKKETQRAMCDRLRGVVEPDGIDFVCKYNKYTYLNPNNVSASPQITPLNLLNEKIIENQFLKPAGVSEEDVIAREALINKN